MEWDLLSLSLAYPIFGAVVLTFLIFLVVRRMREKKKEDFEKRSN